jgi:hypothetical protein
LFGRFLGTMAPSDFSPTCMLGVRLTAFPSRPEPTFGHGDSVLKVQQEPSA